MKPQIKWCGQPALTALSGINFAARTDVFRRQNTASNKKTPPKAGWAWRRGCLKRR